MGIEHTEPEVPDDAVGRRVFCGAERATVRYVGPVPPTEGLWLGVEWEEPSRGKHDGSHDGVQYFTCRHATGGSFVRPAKVSFGVDYLTAVRQAYDNDPDKLLSDTVSAMFKKPIQERSFQSLTAALLGDRQVNGPGSDGEIRKTTPNIKWLDMCRSLLSCWEDVSTITGQLEGLEVLQLSYNTLRLPSDSSSLCRSFFSLKVLSLIRCDLTWPQILECAPMWPQLEDLCVEENNITELQRPEGVLQNVTKLNLSRNPLMQETLVNLSALPRLKQLSLSQCGLSVIRFDDAAPGSQTDKFPELREVNLNDNNISEWCVVDELAKLGSLMKLLCRGNRLTSSDGNRKTADQILIAKLGQLVTLNNCQIHHEERRGAELDYIKMFGGEWLKTGGRSQTSDQFTLRHPRYQSLIDKYGAPEEGELKKPKTFALKNQLLKITFLFPDDAERAPIQKTVPASMLVQKVKGLLQRLLKVPVADLKLTYCTPKKLGTEFELDSDTKTLQFYTIEEGDQVLVRWS
ncbi:tubulin-specific chaperone E [Hippoglossus stenolepis]|uniref:tubulin-specific chaperone E n=1 Tax=Hippoglossus stenolepis TaxID=195615 RepID=UPI00159C9C0D|nr:tubulin-specific chaperone E [Hippoglossus stenolepis]